MQIKETSRIEDIIIMSRRQWNLFLVYAENYPAGSNYLAWAVVAGEGEMVAAAAAAANRTRGQWLELRDTVSVSIYAKKMYLNQIKITFNVIYDSLHILWNPYLKA